MEKYICPCGYVYDTEIGDPENGVVANTKWEDVPEDWVCPWCGFVYYGEKLPDGYVCPLCGCPGDKFTRKEG